MFVDISRIVIKRYNIRDIKVNDARNDDKKVRKVVKLAVVK